MPFKTQPDNDGPSYLELVQLQFVGVLTDTQDILQVHGGLDVLHTQLLQPGQLETQSQFVDVHDEQDVLDVTWTELKDSLPIW